LKQFAASVSKPLDRLTTEDIRHFMRQQAHLSSTSQSRKQAALASFFKWAYQQERIEVNPMERVERVRVDSSAPHRVSREQVEAILAQISLNQKRDRLLFRLLFETGVRIGEALALCVEDIDLTLDDEHITVVGKGQKRRTILLDDPRLVSALRQYLKQTGYKHGPLFRAQKNGSGGAIRYQSVQTRWAKYCAAAGIACTLHQLRHAHATELVNDGVSLATIRKRLGHKNLQTTLRYAEQSNASADAEIRRWRRQKHPNV
jgi:site-specific recombinase XerD